jgi:hypothetical protein
MMRHRVDSYAFCYKPELLSCDKYNIIKYECPIINLVSIPIDVNDKLTLSRNVTCEKANIGICSPLCGMDHSGQFAAFAAEQGRGVSIYGYAPSAGQEVRAVTVASLWLCFNAALLISKIRLFKENDFIHYGAYNESGAKSIEHFASKIKIDHIDKNYLINEFENRNYTSVSACLDYYDEDITYKPWVASWCNIGNSLWRFPLKSMSVSSLVDAHYLSMVDSTLKLQESADLQSAINKSRKYWNSKSFDPVSAFIGGHCLKKYAFNNPIFASEKGLFFKKPNESELVNDLWNDMMEMSGNLVSERIQWSAVKSAVRNWFNSRLRKYSRARSG